MAAIHLSTGADLPLPSIEDESTPPIASSSEGFPPAQSRTPSLTPPPLTTIHQNQYNVSPLVQVFDQGSNIDMSNVAAALESVAAGSDETGQFLGLTSPTEVSPPASGRRSRSRTRSNVAPHDVRNEEPPLGRFHESDFQRAYTDARVFMARLTDVLSSSSLHNEPDSTMNRLQMEASRLRDFQCPPTRTVGFVGDSGVGECYLLAPVLTQRLANYE